jgi:hypothetical protein
VTVRHRQVFLVATVREDHDAAVAVHDEDAVTHDVLPEMW